VVQLQGDLLRALCNPAVTADDVTADWVKARRADIDAAWVERFCAWSKEKKCVLDRMKAIAGLSNADKQALVAHYERNLRYPEAFDAAVPPPLATTPLPDGLSENAVVAYRHFFELYYAPIFYRGKGYPIIDPGLNGQPLTKDQYLEAYHAANPDVKVCPLCDGSMDGAELDHWLAKKHLPEINCHPQNLVEICGACNSGSYEGIKNKGEKLAMETGNAAPFSNWFHPYLRPAAGLFSIRIEHGVPTLASDDPVIQARLNSLDGLVNLTKRWTDEYRTQFKGIEQRIRNHRRHGKTFDEAGLKAQLNSWKTDAVGEQGVRDHKLLEDSLLTLALVDGSDAFVELFQYATE
jgi:hypothetical protein